MSHIVTCPECNTSGVDCKLKTRDYGNSVVFIYSCGHKRSYVSGNNKKSLWTKIKQSLKF